MKVVKIIMKQTTVDTIEAQTYLFSIGCRWIGNGTSFVDMTYNDDNDKFASINVYTRSDGSKYMKYNNDVRNRDFEINDYGIYISFNDKNKYRIKSYIKYGEMKASYEPRTIIK